MKERPILFQGAMVRALLEGRKTQTRRVMKVQPAEMHPMPERDSLLIRPRMDHVDGDHAVFEYTMGEHEAFPCPYGGPGDRLWVRETWMPCNTLGPDQVQLLYKASNDERPDGMSIEDFGAAVWHANRPEEEVNKFRDDILRMEVMGDRWRPSIYMPRWASRITLEIVSVRVERLLQISEEDAIAEGAMRNDAPGEEWDGTYLTQRYIDGIEGAQDDEPHGSARDWYREVWEGINGQGSWARNPGVW